MNSLGLILFSAAILTCVAFVVRLVVWCLVDLDHHTWDITPEERQVWIVALIFLSVVAVMAYVSVGPGRWRWDPRFLWHWSEN